MVVTRTYLPLEMHWSRHDPVFHSYLNLKFVSMHVVLYFKQCSDVLCYFSLNTSNECLHCVNYSITIALKLANEYNLSASFDDTGLLDNDAIIVTS